MRALNLPESHAEQIAWLESEVVGTQLHVLVAELRAIHRVNDEGREDGAFDSSFDETVMIGIRNEGLKALDQSQFESLLVRPNRLLSLQRDVLERGGRYWSMVPTPQDLNTPSLPAELAVTPANTMHRNGVSESTHLDSRSAGRGTFRSHLAWAVVASLATAVACFLVLRPPTAATEVAQSDVRDQSEAPSPESPGSAWGFAKFAQQLGSGTQDTPLSRETYLRELANAAEAWGNKKPESATALAQRIGEFRMGCSAILLSTHEPLTESDQAWLRERCQSWAAALDRHLAEVEQGESADVVRARVDATVTRIAAALLGRADTPVG